VSQIIDRFIPIFDWVLVTTVKASFLVVLLLLVKFLLKNRIGARLHYLLWFVVIISLLLPWTPQSSFSLYNLANSGMRQNSNLIEGVNTSQRSDFADAEFSGEATGNRLEQIAVVQNSNILLNTDESLNSMKTSALIHRLFAILWVMGIAVFIAATVIVNRRFTQKIQGRIVVDPRLLSAFKEAKYKLNVKGKIPLIQTEVVTSPSIFGLFRPRLLIPVDVLEEFNSEQLNHVFVHELFHYKRKDVLVNWLTQGLLILHWFNPILWYTFYKLREDQEIACDAITLNHIDINDSKEYAYTLIKLVESNSRILRITSLASLSGSSSQIKRRIMMIKVFRKVSLKWSILIIAVVVALAFITLTNAKASISYTAGAANASSSSTDGVATVPNVNLGVQTPQSEQSSSVPEKSSDYQKYLSFTPLLPSYTAGYQLTLSGISCNQNTPPGTNSNTYLAAYGSHAAFTIKEARPGEMLQTVIQRTVSDQETKTQIQIGDLPATVTVNKNIDAARIQFTKNNVEYIVSSIPGGGISLDKLKKISESITVSADTPPTDIYINKMGHTASDGLSFKTLQLGDIVVPKGYKFEKESSNIYIKGNEKSEVFYLYYTKGTSTPFLNVQMSIGDHPFGFSDPVLTPDSDFDMKEIDGIEVKLRKTWNENLPAAVFTIKNGLKFSIASTESQSDVEKVVSSILQASSKL